MINAPQDLMMADGVGDGPLLIPRLTKSWRKSGRTLTERWNLNEPAVISKQFACVDYSAAKEGPLVAYRWDGEGELDSRKLAWV